MNVNYLKKIIAQSPEDLHLISACCFNAEVKLDNIKYLSANKIFLISLSRFNNEKDGKKTVNSVLKFDFIDTSKSKNIDQTNPNLILKLVGINLFKKYDKFEITLLFSKNRIITLSAEVIEATLEDQKLTNAKSSKL